MAKPPQPQPPSLYPPKPADLSGIQDAVEWESVSDDDLIDYLTGRKPLSDADPQVTARTLRMLKACGFEQPKEDTYAASLGALHDYRLNLWVLGVIRRVASVPADRKAMMESTVLSLDSVALEVLSPVAPSEEAAQSYAAAVAQRAQDSAATLAAISSQPPAAKASAADEAKARKRQEDELARLTAEQDAKLAKEEADREVARLAAEDAERIRREAIVTKTLDYDRTTSRIGVAMERTLKFDTVDEIKAILTQAADEPARPVVAAKIAALSGSDDRLKAGLLAVDRTVKVTIASVTRVAEHLKLDDGTILSGDLSGGIVEALWYTDFLKPDITLVNVVDKILNPLLTVSTKASEDLLASLTTRREAIDTILNSARNAINKERTADSARREEIAMSYGAPTTGDIVPMGVLGPRTPFKPSFAKALAAKSLSQLQLLTAKAETAQLGEAARYDEFAAASANEADIYRDGNIKTYRVAIAAMGKSEREDYEAVIRRLEAALSAIPPNRDLASLLDHNLSDLLILYQEKPTVLQGDEDERYKQGARDGVVKLLNQVRQTRTALLFDEESDAAKQLDNLDTQLSEVVAVCDQPLAKLTRKELAIAVNTFFVAETRYERVLALLAPRAEFDAAMMAADILGSDGAAGTIVPELLGDAQLVITAAADSAVGARADQASVSPPPSVSPPRANKVLTAIQKKYLSEIESMYPRLSAAVDSLDKKKGSRFIPDFNRHIAGSTKYAGGDARKAQLKEDYKELVSAKGDMADVCRKYNGALKGDILSDKSCTRQMKAARDGLETYSKYYATLRTEINAAHGSPSVGQKTGNVAATPKGAPRTPVTKTPKPAPITAEESAQITAFVDQDIARVTQRKPGNDSATTTRTILVGGTTETAPVKLNLEKLQRVAEDQFKALSLMLSDLQDFVVKVEGSGRADLAANVANVMRDHYTFLAETRDQRLGDYRLLNSAQLNELLYESGGIVQHTNVAQARHGEIMDYTDTYMTDELRRERLNEAMRPTRLIGVIRGPLPNGTRRSQAQLANARTALITEINKVKSTWSDFDRGKIEDKLRAEVQALQDFLSYLGDEMFTDKDKKAYNNSMRNLATIVRDSHPYELEDVFKTKNNVWKEAAKGSTGDALWRDRMKKLVKRLEAQHDSFWALRTVALGKLFWRFCSALQRLSAAVRVLPDEPARRAVGKAFNGIALDSLFLDASVVVGGPPLAPVGSDQASGEDLTPATAASLIDRVLSMQFEMYVGAPSSAPPMGVFSGFGNGIGNLDDVKATVDQLSAAVDTVIKEQRDRVAAARDAAPSQILLNEAADMHKTSSVKPRIDAVKQSSAGRLKKLGETLTRTDDAAVNLNDTQRVLVAEAIAGIEEWLPNPKAPEDKLRQVEHTAAVAEDVLISAERIAACRSELPTQLPLDVLEAELNAAFDESLLTPNMTDADMVIIGGGRGEFEAARTVANPGTVLVAEQRAKEPSDALINVMIGELPRYTRQPLRWDNDALLDALLAAGRLKLRIVKTMYGIGSSGPAGEPVAAYNLTINAPNKMSVVELLATVRTDSERTRFASKILLGMDRLVDKLNAVSDVALHCSTNNGGEINTVVADCTRRFVALQTALDKATPPSGSEYTNSRPSLITLAESAAAFATPFDLAGARTQLIERVSVTYRMVPNTNRAKKDFSRACFNLVARAGVASREGIERLKRLARAFERSIGSVGYAGQGTHFANYMRLTRAMRGATDKLVRLAQQEGFSTIYDSNWQVRKEILATSYQADVARTGFSGLAAGVTGGLLVSNTTTQTVNHVFSTARLAGFYLDASRLRAKAKRTLERRAIPDDADNAELLRLSTYLDYSFTANPIPGNTAVVDPQTVRSNILDLNKHFEDRENAARPIRDSSTKGNSSDTAGGSDLDVLQLPEVPVRVKTPAELAADAAAAKADAKERERQLQLVETLRAQDERDRQAAAQQQAAQQASAKKAEEQRLKEERDRLAATTQAQKAELAKAKLAAAQATAQLATAMKTQEAATTKAATDASTFIKGRLPVLKKDYGTRLTDEEIKTAYDLAFGGATIEVARARRIATTPFATAGIDNDAIAQHTEELKQAAADVAQAVTDATAAEAAQRSLLDGRIVADRQQAEDDRIRKEREAQARNAAAAQQTADEIKDSLTQLDGYLAAAALVVDQSKGSPAENKAWKARLVTAQNTADAAINKGRNQADREGALNAAKLEFESIAYDANNWKAPVVPVVPVPAAAATTAAPKVSSTAPAEPSTPPAPKTQPTGSSTPAAAPAKFADLTTAYEYLKRTTLPLNSSNTTVSKAAALTFIRKLDDNAKDDETATKQSASLFIVFLPAEAEASVGAGAKPRFELLTNSHGLPAYSARLIPSVGKKADDVARYGDSAANRPVLFAVVRFSGVGSSPTDPIATYFAGFTRAAEVFYEMVSWSTDLQAGETARIGTVEFSINGFGEDVGGVPVEQGYVEAQMAQAFANDKYFATAKTPKGKAYQLSPDARTVNADPVLLNPLVNTTKPSQRALATIQDLAAKSKQMVQLPNGSALPAADLYREGIAAVLLASTQMGTGAQEVVAGAAPENPVQVIGKELDEAADWSFEDEPLTGPTGAGHIGDIPAAGAAATPPAAAGYNTIIDWGDLM